MPAICGRVVVSAIGTQRGRGDFRVRKWLYRIDLPLNEITVSVDVVIGKSRLVVGIIGHVYIWGMGRGVWARG